MYKKGDLQILDPPCDTIWDKEYGCCETDDHIHADISDARGGGYISRGTLCAFLPHSCSEWIVGGVDEIRALIKDLRAVLPDEQTIVDEDKLEGVTVHKTSAMAPTMSFLRTVFDNIGHAGTDALKFRPGG